MDKRSHTARSQALNWLLQIVAEKQSASQVLRQASHLDAQDYAFARQLTLGSLRSYPRLSALIEHCLNKPLSRDELDVYLAMILGAYQLTELSTADHAAVAESVELTRNLDKPWAAGLVNAVLRRIQREYPRLCQQLADEPRFIYAHPPWMLSLLQSDWPTHWQKIIEANNQQPPLCIRVNTTKIERLKLQQLWRDKGIETQTHPFARDALFLVQSQKLEQLPGFSAGWFMAQDAAAQLAVDFFDLQPGHKVLDACAAPGGKTTHLLQRFPGIEVTALDVSADRLQRVDENLQRLGFSAKVVQGDASQQDWWLGEPFDAILVDAPCTALGVIRRHPDIKIHRRQRDVNKIVKVQQAILDNCWQMLKPGGRLLYATCSVLKRENELQVADFCARHGVTALPLPSRLRDVPQFADTGMQLLPDVAQSDGFYLCAVDKPV